MKKYCVSTKRVIYEDAVVEAEDIEQAKEKFIKIVEGLGWTDFEVESAWRISDE